MNIFVVTSSFPYANSETFIVPELESLSQADCTISVLPLFGRGPRKNMGTTLESAVKVLEHRLITPAILMSAVAMSLISPMAVLRELFAIAVTSPKYLVGNLACFPKALWLAKQLSSQQTDHVHVHWAGTSGTCAMIACQVSETPFSMTCHRWDIYANNMFARKTNLASFTRFISEKGRRDAIRLGAPAASSYVIHLGVATISKDPLGRFPTTGPFRISCPASFRPVKGHSYLLEALRLVLDRGFPVELSLYGEGPQENAIRTNVNELGLSKNVVFQGFIPTIELLELYKQGHYHLICIPSIDLGGGLHEGIPISLMEAMSMGVPVISTDTGSISELLTRDSGLLIPDRDAPALANKIMQLADNEEAYDASALVCLKLIRSGWLAEQSASELVELFKEHMNGNTNPSSETVNHTM